MQRLWNQKKTNPKEYIMQIKMTPRKLTSFYLFSRFHVRFFFNCCLSECDTTGRPKPQFAGFRKPVRKELYINYPRGNCIVQCLSILEIVARLRWVVVCFHSAFGTLVTNKNMKRHCASNTLQYVICG